MARDSAGNYTLPAGNPVVSGTTIESDGWANPTLSDLANEVTDSLSRSGKGGMLVPLTFVDGTVGAPGVSWTSQTSLGFYRAASNDMRVALGGSDVQRWVSAGAQTRREAAWHQIASELWFAGSGDVATVKHGDEPIFTSQVDGILVQPTTGNANGWARVQDATGKQLQLIKVDGLYAAFRNDDPGQEVRLEVRSADDLSNVSLLRGSEATTWIYGGGTGIKQTIDAAGTSFSEGSAYLVQFATERAWNFRSSGAGAATELRLASETGSKIFRIYDDLDSKSAAVFTPGGRIQLFDDNNTIVLRNELASERALSNSGLTTIDASGSTQSVGFNKMPIAGSPNTTRALTPADCGDTIRSTSTGGYSFTLDDGSLPVNGVTVLQNIGSNPNTLLSGVGVTMRWLTGAEVRTETSLTLGVGSVITVFCASSNQFDVWGSGISA